MHNFLPIERTNDISNQMFPNDIKSIINNMGARVGKFVNIINQDPKIFTKETINSIVSIKETSDMFHRIALEGILNAEQFRQKSLKIQSKATTSTIPQRIIRSILRYIVNEVVFGKPLMSTSSEVEYARERRQSSQAKQAESKANKYESFAMTSILQALNYSYNIMLQIYNWEMQNGTDEAKNILSNAKSTLSNDLTQSQKEAIEKGVDSKESSKTENIKKEFNEAKQNHNEIQNKAKQSNNIQQQSNNIQQQSRIKRKNNKVKTGVFTRGGEDYKTNENVLRKKIISLLN